MSTVLSVLAALVLLSILVTVHELGHFLTGRLLGFSILEFSVGMGPVLLKKEKDGIQYSLRALPIGGMCRFYGEDQEVKDERCFNAMPVWKRLLVVVTGPLMNFLFAILFCILTLTIYGDFVPTICEIPDRDSPAAVGGLEVGDAILAVNGKKVAYYNETTALILAGKGDEMTVTVERAGEAVDCRLQNIYNEEAGRNLIGITIVPERMQYGFFRAVGSSFTYLGSVVKETLGFFGNLFKGQVQSADVAGPVGIITYISQAVRTDFETVLRFAVLISMSLGIMNLLPLPALDGGRAVFMVIEGIRGKPISPEKEGMVHFVGLILLFGLMIFLTYNDISNLVSGGGY